MENKLSSKIETSKTKRYLVITILVALVGCAFLSFSTTFSVWDGLYPSGEYHLKIKNEKGEPVKGALFSVFHGDTKEYAFNYPFDNYLTNQEIVSDDSGVIVILHKPVGFEFGGPCWQLFFLFPICSGGPNYDFQISADGYKTVNFSVQIIFDLAYNTEEKGSASVLLENNEEIELPIYETTITLDKVK